MGKYDYLMHFNPYHDPKSGRFASGGAGTRGRNGERSMPAKGTREYEAAKEKALKSGRAKDVLKFKGDLTNQELQRAMSRIDMERRLSKISSEESSRGRALVGKFKNGLLTAAAMTGAAVLIKQNIEKLRK